MKNSWLIACTLFLAPTLYAADEFNPCAHATTQFIFINHKLQESIAGLSDTHMRKHLQERIIFPAAIDVDEKFSATSSVTFRASSLPEADHQKLPDILELISKRADALNQIVDAMIEDTDTPANMAREALHTKLLLPLRTEMLGDSDSD